MYISPKEFVDIYNVSLSTQFRWRKSGKLPFYKIGSQIMYDKNEIDKLALDMMLNRSAFIATQKRRNAK